MNRPDGRAASNRYTGLLLLAARANFGISQNVIEFGFKAGNV
jgi:hypothetical protein